VLGQLLLGLLLGVAVGGLGWRLAWFSRSGMFAILIVSVLNFVLAGWTWGVLPLAFLASSGIWSRYSAAHKTQAVQGSACCATRDWQQVLAATIWPTTLAVLHLAAPSASVILAAYTGAVAAMTADRWASAVGVLSPRAPRLVTTRRRAIAGAPGGVSLLGSVAALAGAWLIGFLGLLLSTLAAWLKNSSWYRILLWLPLTATVGGMAGCLVDSLLGATAQGVYYCERCQQETEGPVHTCGETAHQVRGWAWLTNEGINFVSAVVGAAVAAGVFAWLAQTNIWW
jgi:uncharacterized protein (TIGR00297 family)